MRNVLRPSAIVACSIAILCCSVVARAQSVDGGFDPGANQNVNTIAVQPDGKTVVGGGFTGLGGGTGTTTRNHIGRLNFDGTVDPGFNPGTNAAVLAIAVQADGKILAGGQFTAVGGGTGLTSSRSHIARFNADGTVDLTFDPGANLNVYALAVQPDGKILVGGNFSKLGGGGVGVTTRIGIGRLNADGTIDPGFNPGASKLPSPGAPPEIYAIVVQPDGKILLGGYFNGLGGGTGTTTRNFIGRLEADGTVDGPFNPGASSISGVNALALQADGKILVGGSFTGLGAGTGTTPRGNIGRLNTDGSVDTFNPGAESQVLTLGVQADGKILAGGYFKWMGNAGGSLKSTRNYIGRLDTSGSVDLGFDPGANNVVNAVALQADGAVVAGGVFDRLGNGASLTPGAGTLRNHIGRITNPAGVQTLALSSNDTVVTWARSGTGPEVSRVTLELSVGSGPYTLLGNGTRVAGGWTLGGLSLPHASIRLRARGYYETGQNGSGSIVESILTGGRAIDGDYDGDGKADLVVFRPSTGIWYTLQSLTSTTGTAQFGLNGDLPVPGDYDGDARTDFAVYRPNSGTWYVQQSTAGFTTVQFGGVGDVPIPADYDGDRRTDAAVYRPSTGEWFILQSSNITVPTVTAGAPGDIPVPADYDGDGKADIALYRPSTGEWFVRRSTTLSFAPAYQFGLNGDIPMPGDYDGDGKADIVVYRPTTGVWYILQSTTNFTTFVQFQWGLPGDVAEPGDYDGDGKADIAIFRPSNGTWYIRLSTTGYATSVTTQFGLPDDTAVPGAVIANAIARVRPVAPLANLTPFNDFDGDHKADLTVFRPSTGTWFTLKSGANYTTSSSTQFGVAGDVPVSGDYDGDGKADIAVFRPSSGTWFVLKSSDSTVSAQQWGLAGDIAVPGDYDGDGKADLAVYRPSSGTWYILKSAGSILVSYAWGVSGDTPVPGDYDGDGISDPAVWRPSTGQWFILKSSGNFATSLQFQWGTTGDIAVPGDFDGDGKTDLGVYRPSTGTWFVSQGPTGNSPTSLIKQFGLTTDLPVAGDYDGDGKTDIAVFRPTTGTWFHLLSGSNYTSSASYQFGLTGDIPILQPILQRPVALPLANLTPFNDFDGDRKADLTVFRPSTGTWFTLKSGTNYTTSSSTQFGLAGDVPVSGDYDGDGKADIAVFRPSSGTWFVLKSSDSTFSAQQWGLAGDIAVPGDYDGDGKADLAVYRPSSGTWYILKSAGSIFVSYAWGVAGDTPVPGDYDGDGISDPAVWRPSTGQWFILKSSGNFATSLQFQWGTTGDIAVPGDFDGDGKTDLGVYRPSTGTWYVSQGPTGNSPTSLIKQFGLSADLPVAGDYDGDGKTDIAVFRPITGTWFHLLSGSNYTSSASYQFGLTGDIPILRRP